VKQYDLAVVGGGPAGLAVALAARNEGLHVAVAEAGRPPLDKACGEGLMAHSLAALRKLGVHLSVDDGAPFKGIRFMGANHTVGAEFLGGAALAVRRTTLHARLVERAESAGVEIHWGSPVCGLEGSQVICRSMRLAARWIVGADGLHSKVRRLAGLNHFVWNRQRVGLRQHFAVRPWSDSVDVHWGAGCQCYVTPIGSEEVSIAFLCRKEQACFRDLLRTFPEVADRIGGAKPTSSVRGGVTALRKVRRIYKENVVLVGDAAGSVDAITGQGIGLAFQQALALAEALTTGKLSRYERQFAAIMRRPMLMGTGLTLLGECGRAREVLLRFLAGKPANFERLLALHVGGPRYAALD